MIPTSSKPTFSRLEITPAAERTMSQSIVILPEGVFTDTLQPSPAVSTDSTDELV
jgi:hypothetical protein